MTPPDNDLNTAGSSSFEEEIQKDHIESQGIYWKKLDVDHRNSIPCLETEQDSAGPS